MAIIDRLGVKDRSGDGRVYEVYPAAALCQWSMKYRGYKGRKDTSALGTLVATLRERAPWLEMSAEHDRLCASCDDAFDALIASLVARAAGKGLTAKPGPEEFAAARIEGWIAMPDPGSLEVLVDPIPS